MKRSGILLCAVLAVAETALATPKPLAKSFTDAFKETLPLAFHALPEKPSQKTVWPLLGRDKLSYQKAFPVRTFADELIMTGVSADGDGIHIDGKCLRRAVTKLGKQPVALRAKRPVFQRSAASIQRNWCPVL